MTARDDDVAARGDELRDALHWDTLIASSLIVPNPPAAGWQPKQEDLA